MNTQLKKRNLIQFYLIEPILRQNSLRQLRTKPTHHYNDRTRNTKEHNQQDYLFLYKSKGQHLLTNQRILDTIVRKSSINPTDTVLEIGPGTGNLTLKLLNVASKVVAVEIDQRMVEVLNKRVKEHGFEEKLSVIREDALKAEFPKFDLVVANIPYGISSPLVAKLVYGVNPFRSATLLLQKEFARRLLAKPGDSEFNRLAVNVKLVANVEFVMNVSKRDFLPAPKVDSSVVIIRPKDQIPDVNLDEWWAFTKTCFGKKNKTLGATFKQKKKVIELFRLSKMASSSGEEMNRNQYVCGASQRQQSMASFSSSDSPWLPMQNKILLSPNSTFAAGFYPVDNSSKHFNFSIWYYKLPRNITTIVWSANKHDSPLSTNASLVITATRELRLTDSSSRSNLWPGAPNATNSNSTRLFLNEDGNLVYDKWESFHFPTDTFLPNQAINGTELVSQNGKFRFLNSTVLSFNYSDNYWTSDKVFKQLNSNGSVNQGNDVSIISADYGVARMRRLTLDNDGNLRVYSHDENLGQWFIAWQALQESCRVHGLCGPNAICLTDSSNSISCVCPPGFRRSSTSRDACERKRKLTRNTKFVQLDYVNFTGGSNQTNLMVRNLTTCRANCLARTNCLGFMFKYDGQGYCVLQLDRLLYGYWSPGTEVAMFLRVDGSETDETNFTGMSKVLETTCPVRVTLPFPPRESNTTTRNIAIICTLFAAELISGILFFWAFLKKYIKYRDMAQTLGLEFLPAGGPKRFTYAELKAATDDFSNAIGKGGFGDVYRGELPDRRIVAVKCLKNVTGGDADFWAEVTIIARMHHLNLVRLWGFCAEKGQRILVYEYVPNGSLDRYLFPAGRLASLGTEVEMGPVAIDGRKPMLDWGIRYRIALGVARAIAYLHEECLEWVLHCDIKPENILLGDDFCPKISDFGLAKLRKKEDMVSMSRIRGTRGYMAPEWIKSDPITPKADVYSFGMVLLEIVTGSRNFEAQDSSMDSEDWYFPRWAFDKVFKEMKVEDILDRQIKHCYDGRVHFDMVDRMVKTALWCLQDTADMRPSMGKVAKMLEGTVEITEPKKPTIFFLED